MSSAATQTLGLMSHVTARRSRLLFFRPDFSFSSSLCPSCDKVLHSLRLSHDTSHHIPVSVHSAPRRGPRLSLFSDSQSRQRQRQRQRQPFHFPSQPSRKNHNYSSFFKRRLVCRLTVSPQRCRSLSHTHTHSHITPLQTIMNAELPYPPPRPHKSWHKSHFAAPTLRTQQERRSGRGQKCLQNKWL